MARGNRLSVFVQCAPTSVGVEGRRKKEKETVISISHLFEQSAADNNRVKEHQEADKTR